MSLKVPGKSFSQGLGAGWFFANISTEVTPAPEEIYRTETELNFKHRHWSRTNTGTGTKPLVSALRQFSQFFIIITNFIIWEIFRLISCILISYAIGELKMASNGVQEEGWAGGQELNCQHKTYLALYNNSSNFTINLELFFLITLFFFLWNCRVTSGIFSNDVLMILKILDSMSQCEMIF